MRIGFDTPRMFFDTTEVMAAVDKATRRVLSRFGAFVRRRARSSIRKRKKASEPGKAPSSHGEGLLRHYIFFNYDPKAQSVVIGPERLHQKSGDAPPALEYGGPSRIMVGGKRQDGRGNWVRMWRVKRTVQIRARPYMGPAFEYEQRESLPKMWRDSVTK